MRTQLASAQAPDTLVFRDLQARPMPPSPEPSAPRPTGEPKAATPPAAAPPPASPPPPTTPAAAEPGAAAPARVRAQVVQVTAMPDLASGKRVQQDLRSAGFDAYLEPVRTSTGEIVRVRIDVDGTTRTVEQTMAELRKLGYRPLQIQR
jgi:cell division septation protein DedD